MRSMPMPKAKPEQLSGSYPTFVKHLGRPYPRLGSQLTRLLADATSFAIADMTGKIDFTLGSVKGKVWSKTGFNMRVH